MIPKAPGVLEANRGAVVAESAMKAPRKRVYFMALGVEPAWAIVRLSSVPTPATVTDPTRCGCGPDGSGMRVCSRSPDRADRRGATTGRSRGRRPLASMPTCGRAY